MAKMSEASIDTLIKTSIEKSTENMGGTSSDIDLPLGGRTILLGVCGSIAAYKAADLCSRLGKLGAEVHVVLTRNAAQFIGAATFRALTRNPVLVDIFDEPYGRRIAHIDLAQSADLVLIAPATANTLAKMAHGFADDLLTTCLLATPQTTPLLAAAAMNAVMWAHPATVANLDTLRRRGVEIVEPGYGVLACQDVGYGKLAEVDEIVSAVVKRLARQNDAAPTISDSTGLNRSDQSSVAQDYLGRRVLVTAGATREPLDPVRFLSNRSSGKMGYAIAAEAALRGATVTLVSGFTTVPSLLVNSPSEGSIEVVRVGTAAEMLSACEANFEQCDLFIAAAAVADYTPVDFSQQKIKKQTILNEHGPTEIRQDGAASDEINLRLKQTPHILATLAAKKRPGQTVVGFAAETQDAVENARHKPYAASLDMIVVNDVTAPGAGFDLDTNIVTLLWADGRTVPLPCLQKTEVAHQLLDALLTNGAGGA